MCSPCSVVEQVMAVGTRRLEELEVGHRLTAESDRVTVVHARRRRAAATPGCGRLERCGALTTPGPSLLPAVLLAAAAPLEGSPRTPRHRADPCRSHARLTK
jgi:hypothetical protein